jgi:hypothetical protein
MIAMHHHARDAQGRFMGRNARFVEIEQSQKNMLE